ncbi:FAD-dependent oxidoreductase [Aquibium sp. A9E412]|uniref:flavin monoamine oxidase family protein n=1 Tax=Aquibium sp. A9E412 TaxID=2976767 RepID=UPI0025B174E0|nr:NAD(P)/FAD-dependent oxidoreductase [Aquibium sp. A9E412]MDN2567878.1 FAD-dependent oxidoreductase [Aquibium sp. A9E412]
MSPGGLRRRDLVKGAALTPLALAAPPIATAAAQAADAIVVGAGMAGLAAANHLRQAGRSVIVLEARRRIGGRILTDRSLGFPVEIGANWIHGTRDNPLTALAAAAGMRPVAFDHDALAVLHADGRPAGPAAAHAQAQDDLDAALARLDGTCRRHRDLAAGLAAALPDGPPGATGRAVRQVLIDRELVSDYGADVPALSACVDRFGAAFGGPDALVTDGYDRLPAHLAQGLDLRLGQPVLALRSEARRVTVETGGMRHTARAAICTVPLGVLKRSAVRFEPALPPAVAGAIARIGFGALAKAVVTFDRDVAMPQPNVAFTPGGGRLFRNLVDLSPFAGRPAVLAYCGGGDAVRAAERDDGAIAGEIAASVRLAARRSGLVATAARVSRWLDDPLCAGAYAFPAPATRSGDFAALGQPIGGRLWLAGEAASAHFGTVHGAYLSGRSAAMAVDAVL